MAIGLRTPTGSTFTANLDKEAGAIVVVSEKGHRFHYRLSAIRDLYLWLLNDNKGQWVLLGTKGEEETPNPGTVEEWARSPSNSIGDWYGMTPGRRGRFASFVPPVLEFLGLIELEHNAKNNRARAIMTSPTQDVLQHQKST